MCRMPYLGTRCEIVQFAMCSERSSFICLPQPPHEHTMGKTTVHSCTFFERSSLCIRPPFSPRTKASGVCGAACWIAGLAPHRLWFRRATAPICDCAHSYAPFRPLPQPCPSTRWRPSAKGCKIWVSDIFTRSSRPRMAGRP